MHYDVTPVVVPFLGDGRRCLEEEEGKEREEFLMPAFGGLSRDPFGSTVYWEIDRAVMRLYVYVIL